MLPSLDRRAPFWSRPRGRWRDGDEDRVCTLEYCIGLHGRDATLVCPCLCLGSSAGRSCTANPSPVLGCFVNAVFDGGFSPLLDMISLLGLDMRDKKSVSGSASRALFGVYHSSPRLEA